MMTGNTRMDAIVVEDLRKRYDAVRALDGLTFFVPEGEVFGLLGPNGAGKSTAVRVLTTLTRADSGLAHVAGEDVRRHPERVRRAIGYVSQDSGVDLQATGRENLMLQGRIHGFAGAPLRKRVQELLELVGLDDAGGRIARGYSGGMKRRLDLAMGLVHRPQILFLDEPTAGLDREARAAIWSEVDRLVQREHLTVVLTTHYLEEAERLAQRVAILRSGRVVVQGTTAELKSSLRGELVTVELTNVHGRETEALNLVGGLESTNDVAFDRNLLRSRVASGAKAIPTMLLALESGGFSVASVSTARPSLDDVYLHYTGRDFAIDDEAGTC